MRSEILLLARMLLGATIGFAILYAMGDQESEESEATTGRATLAVAFALGSAVLYALASVQDDDDDVRYTSAKMADITANLEDQDRVYTSERGYYFDRTGLSKSEIAEKMADIAEFEEEDREREEREAREDDEYHEEAEDNERTLDELAEEVRKREEEAATREDDELLAIEREAAERARAPDADGRAKKWN